MNRSILHRLFLCFLVALATINGFGQLTPPGGLNSLPATGTGPYSISLGSSATGNVSALNKALKTYAWVAVMKSGTYTFQSSILIPSYRRLTIGPGVTLKLANSRFTYLIRNYGTDGAIGTWTAGNTNITIDGGGALDFNSLNNAQVPGNINSSISNWPSMGMYLINCTNVQMRDLSITGSPWDGTGRVNKYLCYFTGGSNILCENLVLNNTSDGLHFHGTQSNIKVRNISGTTNDDMIGVTPSNGGYSSYTPSGTDGTLNGITIENIRQFGNGTCLLLYGYPGAELDNATVRNLYSKPATTLYTVPADLPNTNTNPTFRFGGVNNLFCDGVVGWMPRTSSPLLGVYDATESATVRPCTNLKFKNIVRKDIDPINTIPAGGDSTGRIFSLNSQWKCNDLEIDGFASYQNDGTEGFVFNNGSAVFNVSVTAGTGYVTNFTARNGRVSSIDPANWAVRTTGYMIFSGTGICYNGSSYTGAIRIEDCQVKSLQFLSVPTDNGSSVLRYAISNNVFDTLDRGVQCLGETIINYSGNTWIGTTSYPVQLGSSTADQKVDLKWGQGNSMPTANIQAHSSPATRSMRSMNGGSGIRFINAGLAQTIFLNVFDYDRIIVGTYAGVTAPSTGSLDLRLSDAYPGREICVTNNGTGSANVAVRTATTSTNNVGGSTTYNIAAGVSARFRATDYLNWAYLGTVP